MKEMEGSVSKRDYRMDNIKGILIILVVFGHLLELVLQDNPLAHRIYCMIYIFHMPMFIFTTGYFSRYNLKKVCFQLLYPYLIFQTLYQVFSIEVLNSKAGMQYETPYWILWYLFTVIVWTVTEGIWNIKLSQRLVSLVCGREVSPEQVKQVNKVLDAIIFTLFFVVSIQCGKWSFVGRTYSLSRILVYFPFFIAGAFTRKRFGRSQPVYLYKKDLHIRKDRERMHAKITRAGKYLALCLTVTLLMIVSVRHQDINRTWLYEATSYETSHYGPGIRMALLVAGFLVIWAAMQWIPDRRWTGISKMGEHTLSVFLLHGFLIKWMERQRIGQDLVNYAGKEKAVMILLITAVGITFVLSGNIIFRIMKPLTSFDFFWKRKPVQQPPTD